MAVSDHFKSKVILRMSVSSETNSKMLQIQAASNRLGLPLWIGLTTSVAFKSFMRLPTVLLAHIKDYWEAEGIPTEKPFLMYRPPKSPPSKDHEATEGL